MSAQTKLAISTRLISSQILEPDTSAVKTPNNDEIQSTDSIIDLEHLDEVTAKAITSLSKLKDAISETTQEEPSSSQSDEVAALQHSILSEDNFDFSSLPSTSAGFDENAHDNTTHSNSTSQTSFTSDGYVETASNNSYETSTTANSRTEPSQGKNEIDISLQAFESDAVDNTSKSLGTFHQSVTEDIRLEISGQIKTDFQLESSNQETNYGLFEIGSDGLWKYTLNNQAENVQQLSANGSAIDSINILTQNGDTFTLNITVNGVNDNASISGDLSSEISALNNSTNNEQPETVNGKLSVRDIDQNEAQMYEEEMIEGSYGSMQIDADGEWVYTLDSESDAIKSLHSNDSLYDLIPVKSIDGSGQLIKITIHGADDKPFLNGDNSETIDLASTLHAEQKLSIDDPDFGQSHFIAKDHIESRLDYGTGSNDEHGNWRFELNTDNPQVLALSNNEHLFDTFNVESADGTTQEVIIVIKGSDHPIFATPQASEDGLISYKEDTEDQQTLDNYLGTTEPGQATTSTISDATSNSSGEILQQLQQQSTYDGNTLT